MQKYDMIIIGGGIIGLSTAWQLKKSFPGLRMLVLEKEPVAASHQTGRNSGVVHAGVYYQPGSLKARFCREGNRVTFEFCRRHGIPVERCGKMLVATDPQEYRRMEDLFQRILKNGIRAERLTKKGITDREPNISGVGALFIPDTGIVDYRQITCRMADLFTDMGGKIQFGAEVTRLTEASSHVDLEASGAYYTSRYLISCAGLHSDRLVKMLGIKPDFQIIPFRGEYFKISPGLGKIIHHLIYPIPDPALPFLGIHLTRMIDGSVTAGPNAVMGLKREGYRKTDIDFYDLAEMMVFSGFWRVVRQHIGPGLMELKNSMIKSAYLKQVHKYCPAIQLADLYPYPAGVRAQAVHKNGELIHDFLFVNTTRSIHVCNAPSPAATSAIPIGRHILEKAASLFGL
jgi:L-2-hydroxyglutarate oxidase